MSDAFDPYYTWLGIPPKDQPPDHYRLLGVERLESNPDVIENAADRQMAHVRTFAAGKHAEDSQRLLNEIAAAKVCLLTPQRKADYDLQFDAAPDVPWAHEMAVAEALPTMPQFAPRHDAAPRDRRPKWVLPAALGGGGALLLILILAFALGGGQDDADQGPSSGDAVARGGGSPPAPAPPEPSPAPPAPAPAEVDPAIPAVDPPMPPMDSPPTEVPPVETPPTEPPPAEDDVDRQVAEWATALGAQVMVWQPGERSQRTVRPGSPLPKGEFAVSGLMLLRRPVTDADLPPFARLRRLERLYLDDTQVTDAGLAHLANLRTLQNLGIRGTRITDEGLRHVRGLINLRYLMCGDTDISDAGLAHIAGLRRLYTLNIGNTRVGDAGLVRLRDLRSLRTLYLYGTNVTGEGSPCLSNCQTSCS